MTPPPAKAPCSRRPATTEPELFIGAELLTAPDPENPDPEDDEPDLDAEMGPLRRCMVTRERLPKERMIRFVLSPDRMVVPDLTARLPGRGIWLSARGDVLETARAQGSLARAFAKYASKGVAKDAAADAPLDALEGAEKDSAKIGARLGAKMARGSVTLTPDFPDLIEAMLLRRIVELLGLARRAGQAVCGFQKAREWLTSNRAGLVLQASDGSVDERARFLSGVTIADMDVTKDLPRAGDLDVIGDGGANSGNAGPDDRMTKEAIPVGSPLPAASLGAVFGRDHVVHVVVAPGRLAEALTNEIARLSGVSRHMEPGRAEPGRKNAKAGRKAAGGDAGKIEAGQTGQDHDMNKRAGA